MTRFTLLALGAFLTLPACSTSPDLDPRAEALYERQDRNGDGLIMEDDILSAQRERFLRADRDGSGNLSPEEFTLQRESTPRQRGPGGRRGNAQNFMALDRNEDGLLSLEEFADPALRRFDRSDRNRDGRITREEFSEAMPSRRRRGDSRPPR